MVFICAGGSFWVITDFLMRSDAYNLHKYEMVSLKFSTEKTNRTCKIWYRIYLTCQKLARLTICNLNEWMNEWLNTSQFERRDVSIISRSAEKRLHLSQRRSAAEFDLFEAIVSSLCDIRNISTPKLPVDVHLFYLPPEFDSIWRHKHAGVPDTWRVTKPHLLQLLLLWFPFCYSSL